MESFPRIENLYSFFAPHYWGYALQHLDDCLTKPCIMLRQIDELYGKQGVAKTIVKTQIVGVYSLTTARESLNTNTADLAADLFIANFGYRCSLYGMMVFFAKYVTDFKETKSSFDVQDILKQFREKFLMWWCSQIPEEKVVEEKDDGKPKGVDALRCVIRQWLEDGENPRDHDLYKIGYIDEKVLREVEQEFKDNTF